MSQAALPPHILNTNHIPSDEEASLIQSLISIHQKRALALDAEVERAQAALETLEIEKRAQDELLDAHKALLTPMRRVIPDVLLEIFHHCHRVARDSPMRLARVCRKWRGLVLSTPTLWTVVNLRDSTPTKRIVPFARACVRHSGSCSLRVLINVMNRRSDTQTVRKALLQALGILVQHIHRWQSYELLVHQAYKPDDDTMGFAEAAPQLEKIIMLAGDAGTPLPFLSLPNLRDLRLFLPHPKDIPLILRCTTIRNLHIGSPSGQLTLMDCWTIFSNCPSIETFDVSGIKPSVVIPREPLTLPSLRELRIGPFAPDPAPLMHCVRAPALQQLRLLVGKSMDFDSSCLSNFVHGCCPPLTSLSLVNIDGMVVALCLSLLPDLTSLVLQHASASDLVIRRLTERDDTGQLLCPGLVRLGFRLCLFTGLRLVELARARRVAAGGLRVLIGDDTRHREGEFDGLTIELHLVGEFSDTELEELRGLQTVKETDRRVRRRISVGQA